MIAARERGWKGKFTKPGRVLRPGANRVNGKCPLTPLEVKISFVSVCLSTELLEDNENEIYKKDNAKILFDTPLY